MTAALIAINSRMPARGGGGGVINVDPSKFLIGLTEYDTIEAAVAGASSGDVILVPQGTHTVTSTVTVPDGVSLQGFGRHASIITGEISAAAVIQANGDHSFSDLKIRNSSSNASANGLSIGTGATSQIVTVNRCECYGLSSGLNILAGGASSQIMVRDLVVTEIGAQALFIRSPDFTCIGLIARGEIAVASGRIFAFNSSGLTSPKSVIIGSDVDVTYGTSLTGAVNIIKDLAISSNVSFHGNRFVLNGDDQATNLIQAGSGSSSFTFNGDYVSLTTSGTATHIDNNSTSNTYTVYGGNIFSRTNTTNGNFNMPVTQNGGSLGFYGKTPIAQPAKASYDNLADAGDFNNLHFALGLVDAGE